MTTTKRNAQEWLRDGRAAARAVSSRAHPARGWNALQERDSEGNPLGPLPYTEEAIREFTVAHQRNHEDIGVAHHLAIAHHARAWDWELQGDPRAAAEWVVALGFWRMVAASGEFWAAMKAKLLDCHEEADAAFLDETRRDLLEHLLEVHVAFVRHYCESDEPERANSHIELVRGARLPPAVKKRLVYKVFDAMTGSVPEARATGAYEAAFAVIERILNEKLFPDYLPALRMHAEIAKEQAVGLSFQTQWEEILKLGARALPHARRIAEHTDLGNQPLARAALEELSLEMATLGHSRGEKFLATMDPQQLDADDLDAAAEGLDFAIAWERLGTVASAPGSQLKTLLGASLQDRGVCFYLEAMDVRARNLDERTKVSTMTQLYREAVKYLEEALSHATEDDELHSLHKRFLVELAELETRLALLEAMSGRWPGDWEERQ